ncbi:MAG TPA: DUF4956 domain-containing protein [Bacteroidales bacterium]|nr:DUF4956 domain-containing protein [Bacteroidales bacterium]
MDYTTIEELKLYGISLINLPDLYELIIRFIFNLIINLLIVRWLYYSTTRRKDYLFTYILISLIVFFICFLLSNVKLQIGFALGLFAIFGILRYRTSQIPIREMTYLFLVIGISVINSLAGKKISYAELLFTNFAIIFITYGLEKLWLFKHEASKQITYDKIHLIKPDKHNELITDLKERTGLNIHRIEIGKINFLNDTATIIVYYYEKNKLINSTEYFFDNNKNNRNNDEDDDLY